MRPLLRFLLLLMAWTQRLRASVTRLPLMDTIRRSAEAVMTRHRSGGTEAMYHRSLEVELYYKGVCYLSEVDCYMMSGSVPIRVGRLDMEVDHRVILELKVAPKITAAHVQQLRKYVRARASTGMHVEGAAVICFTDKDTVEFLEVPIPSRQAKSPYFRFTRAESEPTPPT
jgi:GxxExxY protein